MLYVKTCVHFASMKIPSFQGYQTISLQKKDLDKRRKSTFTSEYRMNVNVLLLSLALCCVSHGASEPLHQSNQRGLQFIMKTLVSLTNHSGKVKKKPEIKLHQYAIKYLYLIRFYQV